MTGTKGDVMTSRISDETQTRSIRRRLAVPFVLLALLAFGAAAPAGASAAQGSYRNGIYGPIYEHLLYGPKYRQNVDVYVSPLRNSPVVVLIHGGGWRFYDPLSRFEKESLYLQQQGYTVFTINYDQDSEKVPAFALEPDDVTLAIQWATAHAGEFNGNPGDVVLLGGSAGAHLAAAVAERLDASAPGTIRGVVLLSAPTDLTMLTSMIAAGTVTNEEFVLSEREAVGRTATGEPYLYTQPWQQEGYERTWSPALTVNAHCPKWLIFNSTSELIPLQQAQELNSSLHAGGCQSTLKVVQGTRHAFGYWTEVAGEISDFIRTA